MNINSYVCALHYGQESIKYVTGFDYLLTCKFFGIESFGFISVKQGSVALEVINRTLFFTIEQWFWYWCMFRYFMDICNTFYEVNYNMVVMADWRVMTNRITYGNISFKPIYRIEVMSHYVRFANSHSGMLSAPELCQLMAASVALDPAAMYDAVY